MRNKNIVENGMSIVEVMVALGLLGAISLGVMKVMENSQKASKNLKTTDDILQITNEINAILSNPLNCQRTFSGYAIGGTPLGVYSYIRGTAVLKHTASNNPSKVQANLKSILVKNIDFSNNPSKSLAEVELTFNKPDSSTSLGGKEVKRSIKLNVNLCPETILVENPNYNFGSACSGTSKRLVAGPYDMKLGTDNKRWAVCQDCSNVTQGSTIFSCSANSSGGAGVDLNNLSKLNCLNMGGVFDEATQECKLSEKSLKQHLCSLETKMCFLYGCKTENCNPNVTLGMIHGGVHGKVDCELANGEIITVENGVKICRFNAANCPTSGNWTQYKNWSATDNKTCSDISIARGNFVPNDGWNACKAESNLNSQCGQGTSVNSGSHTWADTQIEEKVYKTKLRVCYDVYSNCGDHECFNHTVGKSYLDCDYTGGGSQTKICKATRTQVGCY